MRDNAHGRELLSVRRKHNALPAAHLVHNFQIYECCFFQYNEIMKISDLLKEATL